MHIMQKVNVSLLLDTCFLLPPSVVYSSGIEILVARMR